jgi:hypothetical protein
MELFLSLVILFFSTFLARLALCSLYKKKTATRIWAIAGLGVVLFQAANYFKVGYVDPFFVVAIVVSFPFSLAISFLLELITIKFFKGD